jgi:hypothetical protein
MPTQAIERCSALTGDDESPQCRKTKHLTPTVISIHREESFLAKLPEHAVVLLCPDHLKLSVLEGLLMSRKTTIKRKRSL